MTDNVALGCWLPGQHPWGLNVRDEQVAVERVEVDSPPSPPLKRLAPLADSCPQRMGSDGVWRTDHAKTEDVAHKRLDARVEVAVQLAGRRTRITCAFLAGELAATALSWRGESAGCPVSRILAVTRSHHVRIERACGTRSPPHLRQGLFVEALCRGHPQRDRLERKQPARLLRVAARCHREGEDEQQEAEDCALVPTGRGPEEVCRKGKPRRLVVRFHRGTATGALSRLNVRPIDATLITPLHDPISPTGVRELGGCVPPLVTRRPPLVTRRPPLVTRRPLTDRAGRVTS